MTKKPKKAKIKTSQRFHVNLKHIYKSDYESRISLSFQEVLKNEVLSLTEEEKHEPRIKDSQKQHA